MCTERQKNVGRHQQTPHEAWQIICCLREYYIRAAQKRARGKKCHVISANSAQCLSSFILCGANLCGKRRPGIPCPCALEPATGMQTGRETKSESMKIVWGHAPSHVCFIYERMPDSATQLKIQLHVPPVNCEIKWIFMLMQLAFLHSQPPLIALVAVELIKCFSNSRSIIKLVTERSHKREIKLTTALNVCQMAPMQTNPKAER